MLWYVSECGVVMAMVVWYVSVVWCLGMWCGGLGPFHIWTELDPSTAHSTGHLNFLTGGVYGGGGVVCGGGGGVVCVWWLWCGVVWCGAVMAMVVWCGGVVVCE